MSFQQIFFSKVRTIVLGSEVLKDGIKPYYNEESKNGIRWPLGPSGCVRHSNGVLACVTIGA